MLQKFLVLILTVSISYSSLGKDCTAHYEGMLEYSQNASRAVDGTATWSALASSSVTAVELPALIILPGIRELVVLGAIGYFGSKVFLSNLIQGSRLVMAAYGEVDNPEIIAKAAKELGISEEHLLFYVTRLNESGELCEEKQIDEFDIISHFDTYTDLLGYKQILTKIKRSFLKN